MVAGKQVIVVSAVTSVKGKGFIELLLYKINLIFNYTVS
jgi:hypothetical protein